MTTLQIKVEKEQPLDFSHLPLYSEDIVASADARIYYGSHVVGIAHIMLVWTVKSQIYASYSIPETENETIIKAILTRIHDIQAVAVLTNRFIRFYFENGKNSITTVPNGSINIFSLGHGIVIQCDEVERGMPTIFTLLDPIEEAKPIMISGEKNSFPEKKLAITSMYGAIQKISRSDPSSGLIFTHNSNTRTAYIFKYSVKVANFDVTNTELRENNFDEIFKFLSPLHCLLLAKLEHT